MCAHSEHVSVREAAGGSDDVGRRTRDRDGCA
jgi:hypothetical protein